MHYQGSCIKSSVHEFPRSGREDILQYARGGEAIVNSRSDLFMFLLTQGNECLDDKG